MVNKALYLLCRGSKPPNVPLPYMRPDAFKYRPLSRSPTYHSWWHLLLACESPPPIGILAGEPKILSSVVACFHKPWARQLEVILNSLVVPSSHWSVLYSLTRFLRSLSHFPLKEFGTYLCLHSLWVYSTLLLGSTLCPRLHGDAVCTYPRQPIPHLGSRGHCGWFYSW